MSPEKHGRGVEQARQMLDTFASVGVEAFDLTWTDVDGHKQNFASAQAGPALQRQLPAILAAAAQRQHNVIVRPKRARAELVQLDDLPQIVVERLWNRALLILTTSPANHQVWVAVREGGVDFVRRLRQGTGADRSASGAARLAGSVNFKPKYDPAFPPVRILHATPGNIVNAAALEELGLVAAPVVDVRIPSPRVSLQSRVKQWPSYERCLQNAPRAHHSDRPDVSRADFTFCLLAVDWGWSIGETCERLLEMSNKARENGPTYALRTAQNAAAAVYRRSLNYSQAHGKNDVR
jgi:hypothetical protein